MIQRRPPQRLVIWSGKLHHSEGDTRAFLVLPKSSGDGAHFDDFSWLKSNSLQIYPLVIQHSYWKWPIYRLFTYWTWWFSIAMLNYQRYCYQHILHLNSFLPPLITLTNHVLCWSWPDRKLTYDRWTCSHMANLLQYPTENVISRSIQHTSGYIWID